MVGTDDRQCADKFVLIGGIGFKLGGNNVFGMREPLTKFCDPGSVGVQELNGFVISVGGFISIRFMVESGLACGGYSKN